MKLKTKLIPLTGLSLLGTTIVPLTLTSCGTNIATGVGHNLTKFYFPTIKRMDPRIMSAFYANKFYVEQMRRNPDTFTQDYLWSKSWNGAAFDQYALWQTLLPTPDPTPGNVFRFGTAQDLYEYDNEVISNLSWTTQESKTIESLDELTLSFTLKFNADILTSILNQVYLQDDTTGYVNGYVSGEISFNHVPFIIRSREVYYYGMTEPIRDVLSLEPDAEFMKKDGVEPWEIKFYVASSISGQLKYSTGVYKRIANDFVFNKKVNNDPNTQTWPEYGFGFEHLTNLFSSSYYLERITLI